MREKHLSVRTVWYQSPLALSFAPDSAAAVTGCGTPTKCNPVMMSHVSIRVRLSSRLNLTARPGIDRKGSWSRNRDYLAFNRTYRPGLAAPLRDCRVSTWPLVEHSSCHRLQNAEALPRKLSI